MSSYKKIDSHAHLDMSQFDGDRKEVIYNSLKENTICLNMGTDVDSDEKVLNMSTDYSNLYAGIGFHPHQASSFDGEILAELKNLATKSSPVAIGEIGLDYYRENSPRKKQREVFEEMLDLAVHLDLPVSIHNRSSTDDMLEILRRDRYQPLQGAIHSFFGDRDLAEEFTDMGLMLGISGPVTYPENGDQRSTVKKIPLEHILVETDAPYLSPAPHRGERNEPNYVEYIIKEIAKVKDVPENRVAEGTTENARRCFGLDGKK